MTDSDAVIRARHLVTRAQLFMLLGLVLPFLRHGAGYVYFALTVFAAGLIVTMVVTTPIADRVLRWLIGLAAVGLPASLISLWLIRDEEAAIPIGEVGGLLLSLALTLASLIALQSMNTRASSASA